MVTINILLSLLMFLNDDETPPFHSIKSPREKGNQIKFPSALLFE